MERWHGQPFTLKWLPQWSCCFQNQLPVMWLLEEMKVLEINQITSIRLSVHSASLCAAEQLTGCRGTAARVSRHMFGLWQLREPTAVKSAGCLSPLMTFCEPDPVSSHKMTHPMHNASTSALISGLEVDLTLLDKRSEKVHKWLSERLEWCECSDEGCVCCTEVTFMYLSVLHKTLPNFKALFF